jgi:hypothetical protein
MLPDVPPAVTAPLPAMTSDQQADLRCVVLGQTLADLPKPKELGPVAKTMVRVYLARLKHSDPSRNWRAMARPTTTSITYGEFIGALEDCQQRLPSTLADRASPSR